MYKSIKSIHIKKERMNNDKDDSRRQPKRRSRKDNDRGQPCGVHGGKRRKSSAYRHGRAGKCNDRLRDKKKRPSEIFL